MQTSSTTSFSEAGRYVSRKHPLKLKALFADNTRRIQYPEELLELLGELSGDSRYQEVAEHILYEKGDDITMCTIADELEKRGIERGLERGVTQGRAETLNLVRLMVLNGDTDLIASLSESEELYQQMYQKYFCS